MSSMAELSARQHRLDSRLRRAALADAGTVPQVDRMVAASAQAQPIQRPFTVDRSRRADAMKAVPIDSRSRPAAGQLVGCIDRSIPAMNPCRIECDG